MKLPLGHHYEVAEYEGPKVYEVRNGNRYLESLEDGKISFWPEYHTIMLDERSGRIFIDGTYGTFAFCWTLSGRGGEPLHSWLYDVHFSYFMGKAAKQPYRVADSQATIAKLKRELISDRRDGSISNEEARELWDDLRDREEEDCGEMVRSLYRDTSWYKRFDGDDPSVMVDHPCMRHFWDDVWKPFRERVLRPHWEAYNDAKRAQVAA